MRTALALLVLATAPSVLGCNHETPPASTAAVAPPVTAAPAPAEAKPPAETAVTKETAKENGLKPDAQMQAVLDMLGTLGGKPLETLTAAEARKQPTPADAVKKLLEKQGKKAPMPTDLKVEDKTVQGATGKIPARFYTPTSVKGPLPVLVYFHGGGFVIADKDVYDSAPRTLASAVGCVVVSVDYRRAPENKFPAAHDDAFAAYQWVVKNAASIGGDPKKIAIAGESAGGNLAASVSIAARDKGVQMPLHQLLVYPIAGDDMNTESYKDSENAKPLNKVMMGWFADQYFKAKTDAKDPRVNILGAKLQGLPKTTVILARIDPLRSDGELLTAKLREAGVTVEQKTFEGVTHEFFGMGAVVDKAGQAVDMAGKNLKMAFGS